jgi:nucleoside-diphosphate-sugar epimerase
MRVLITGATGFVGSAAIAALKAQGHSLIAAVRRPLTPGVEAIRIAPVGDIGPDTDWQSALDGCEAVVHLAARVHVMRDRHPDPLAAYRHVNVAGTHRLAEQAAAAGVRRFVFVSSVHAIHGSHSTETISRAAKPAPTTDYGRSKLEAERVVEAIGRSTGMDTVILRPPLVYGPGVGGNFASLLAACWRHWPLPIGGVPNRRSLIFVENLGNAIERALTHPTAAGQDYFVQDGSPMSTEVLVRSICQGLGRRPIIVPLPPPVERVASRIARVAVMLDRLNGSLAVDDSPIRAELGWQPPHSFEAGIAATTAWYRAQAGDT